MVRVRFLLGVGIVWSYALFFFVSSIAALFGIIGPHPMHAWLYLLPLISLIAGVLALWNMSVFIIEYRRDANLLTDHRKRAVDVLRYSVPVTMVGGFIFNPEFFR